MLDHYLALELKIALKYAPWQYDVIRDIRFIVHIGTFYYSPAAR